MPVIPASQEAEVGGSWFNGGLSKSKKPYLKNKVKAWAVAQVVEH
jgi:hypothetical protein